MRRAIFLVLILLLGVFAYLRLSNRNSARFTPAGHPKLQLRDVQNLAALDEEYTRLVEAVVPSVVSITTARRVSVPQAMDPAEYFFGRRSASKARVQTSLGSGVIVSKEGHILTNHHVIANMEAIQVQLTDGRTLAARLLGSDPQTDIAVLKISAANLPPLSLADSDQVKVGQMVFAVGNPFGLQETVTRGIVSAKGRRAIADSGVEFLQTDAAVNQGNSGGPLLNLRGEIIGINTAIYSQSGGWLGISFAVPANVARRTLESIVREGRIVRGYLGVTMMHMTPDFANELNEGSREGALITDVEEASPAEKSGLQPGDVVRGINGHKIQDILSARERIAQAPVGSTLKIEVMRGGKTVQLTAVVMEAPSQVRMER